jgi:predicted TIM-barrel fold metal-dependent hydrolase
MPEIIDIHPHIVSHDTAKYPMVPLGGKRSDWSHERSVTFEELVKALDEAGVAKAVIVHSSTTYGFDSSYVADSIATNPKRFAGVFSSNVLADDAVEQIVYWKKRGMGGLRIFSKGSTMEKQWLSLDDARLYPVYEKCGELGLSVCINVHANEEESPQVHAILKRFPNVNFLQDHLGRPKINDGPPYNKAKALFDFASYPNFYLKLTPRLLEDVGKSNGVASTETFLPKLVGAFGADRIAFGSNYPSSPGTLPDLVRDMVAALKVLKEADQAAILSGTAKKLYPQLA